MASARVRRSEASRNAAPLLVDNRGILTTKSKSPVRCRNAETELFHFHLRGLPSFPLPNEKMFFFSLSLSLRENCQPMREISKSTRAKAEPKIKRGRERERESESKGADGYIRDEFLFFFSLLSFFPRKKETGPPTTRLSLFLFPLSKGQRGGGSERKRHTPKKKFSSREDLAGFTRALSSRKRYIRQRRSLLTNPVSLSLSLLDPGRDLPSF